MIYTRPFRRTTLHFEQRGLTDDVTFTTISPLLLHSFGSQRPDYTCLLSVRPVF